MAHSQSQTKLSGAARVAAAALCLAALVAAALAAGPNPADAVSAKELGKTGNTPSPNCPDKSADGETPSDRQACQVTGQVTGFQRSADGKKGLFRVRENGKIVAWSIDLAKPTQEERDIFGEAAQTPQWGKRPTAGISIVKPKGNRTWKLMRKSPVLGVEDYYGEKPLITLDKPLRVTKGDWVALTTETWLPAFSIKGLSRDDKWVASRPKSKCEIPDSVPPEDRLQYFFDNTRPHTETGTERKYQCTYDSARILYWAYFVKRN